MSIAFTILAVLLVSKLNLKYQSEIQFFIGLLGLVTTMLAAIQDILIILAASGG
jgi:hypothetical protein